jgi:hypothetical protein
MKSFTRRSPLCLVVLCIVTVGLAGCDRQSEDIAGIDPYPFTSEQIIGNEPIDQEGEGSMAEVMDNLRAGGTIEVFASYPCNDDLCGARVLGTLEEGEVLLRFEAPSENSPYPPAITMDSNSFQLWLVKNSFNVRDLHTTEVLYSYY